MLQPICDNIWHVQYAFKTAGLPMSSRMTIVRLSDGGLWVHSPVAIDDALQAEISPCMLARNTPGSQSWAFICLKVYPS